jgi:hypothetical protein
MYLHRDDLTKMLEILGKFPTVEVVDVTSDTSSGIGTYTIMKFNTEINGQTGSFEVEISGVESW